MLNVRRRAKRPITSPSSCKSHSWCLPLDLLISMHLNTQLPELPTARLPIWICHTSPVMVCKEVVQCSLPPRHLHQIICTFDREKQSVSWTKLHSSFIIPHQKKKPTKQLFWLRLREQTNDWNLSTSQEVACTNFAVIKKFKWWENWIITILLRY